MSPIQQILAQSGAGSADGQGFAQFAAQGMQLAQDNRRLNLAERRQSFEEQQQSMLMPLEMESMRLNNERTGLAVQTGMMQLRQQNQLLSNLPALVDLQMKFANSERGYQDPDLIAEAQSLLTRSPLLATTEQGQSIMESIAAAPKIRQSFDVFKQLSQALPEGTVPQSVDLKTGKVTLMQEPRAVNLPANIQEANEITRLETLLQQTTDPAQKEQITRQLNNIRQQTAPRGNIIRTMPDGTTEVIMGTNVNDLTPNQRGNNRQQALKLEDAARRLGDIIPKVNEIFGAANATKTLVVDRILSQAIPGLADGQRIQGRAAAGMAIEGLIRSLSEGQGALSNADVQRLTSKFPALNNPQELIESPERAKQVLIALQKEFSRDAYNRVRLLGDSPTDEVLRLLDPMFVLQEFQGNRLTKEQYQKAINNTVHAEELNELINARKGNGR